MGNWIGWSKDARTRYHRVRYPAQAGEWGTPAQCDWITLHVFAEDSEDGHRFAQGEGLRPCFRCFLFDAEEPVQAQVAKES